MLTVTAIRRDFKNKYFQEIFSEFLCSWQRKGGTKKAGGDWVVLLCLLVLVEDAGPQCTTGYPSKI